MRFKIYFLLVLTLSHFIVAGQIINPSYYRKEINYCDITKIEKTGFSTTVYFKYTSPSTYTNGGWVCAGKDFFIRDYDNKTKYKLLKANGIPICPQKHNFNYQGQTLEFNLVFEALPSSTTRIDVIEDESSAAFNFFGVSLTTSIPSSNSPIINNPSPSKPNVVSNASDCDVIKTTNASSKPDLNTFLAGVRYAVIINQAKINGHIPAFNALVQYLKAMGFENIEYLNKEYIPATNVCEEAWVDIGFEYDLNKFYNVKWTFFSPCMGYSWELNSSQSARAGYYDNAQNNFYNLLRNLYQYKKPSFNSIYTLKKANQQTCWTEYKIKDIIKQKGCDRYEGIYENSSSATSARYKVAVRKINGTYHLIYLSGAENNASLWKEGDIKASLEPTATSAFFKAKWVMADKTVNDEHYISFDQGLFNLLNAKSEKELYIKLFPTANDNISSLPSDIQSSGTGFAISSTGYIVTNHHVTQGASKIKVRGINGDFSKAYSARIITEDKNNDISIIKIDEPGFSSLGSIPFTIANRTSDVGMSVFVLGYPLRASMGDEIKLTNGIISSKSGFQGDITSYQMTAPIQPGNSGGPMFDEKGTLVGIVNAKHRGAENASYAIKSSYLLNLIDLLPNSITLPTINQLNGKALTEQVKIVKKFTYIIEVN